jgi:phasin family protein
MFDTTAFATAQNQQFANLFSLTQKAFAGVEKLVELNMETARTALTEAGQTRFDPKDAQTMFAAPAEALQPAADKATEYGRQVADIVTETQAEFTQFADAGVAQARAQWLALVDNVVKNAPAGSENVVGMLKSSVIAANDAFDNLQRTSRQAAEGLQANLMAAAPKMAKTAKASKARRMA